MCVCRHRAWGGCLCHGAVPGEPGNEPQRCPEGELLRSSQGNCWETSAWVFEPVIPQAWLSQQGSLFSAAGEKVLWGGMRLAKGR